MPANTKTLHPGVSPDQKVSVTMMVQPDQWKEHPNHSGIWYAKQDIHPHVLAKSCGFEEEAASLLHSNTHGIQKISTAHVSGLPEGAIYAVQHGARKADGTEYSIEPRQSKVIMTGDRALPCDDVFMPGQNHHNTPAVYDHSTHDTRELTRLVQKWHQTNPDHVDEGTIKLDSTQTEGKGDRRLVPVEHPTNPTSKLLENKDTWSKVGHSGIIEHDGISYHDVDEAKLQTMTTSMREVLDKTRAGSDPRVVTHYVIGDKPEIPIAVQHHYTLGCPEPKPSNAIITQAAPDDPTKTPKGYNLEGKKPITTTAVEAL